MKTKYLPSKKFTQEVKDAWLKALKSGEYIQCDTALVEEPMDESEKVKHCCIGVLGDIHPELDNSTNEQWYNGKGQSPYTYLKLSIGEYLTEDLWKLNDNTFDPKVPNYSNVIPFIESLNVQV